MSGIVRNSDGHVIVRANSSISSAYVSIWTRTACPARRGVQARRRVGNGAGNRDVVL